MPLKHQLKTFVLYFCRLRTDRSESGGYVARLVRSLQPGEGKDACRGMSAVLLCKQPKALTHCFTFTRH